MIAVIPAYKPTRRMIGVIAELVANSSYKVVLVDDGSGAEYAPLFEEAGALGCVLLRHDVNRGKGAALKTAFAWVQAHRPGNGIVCADSDGQHCVGDIISIAGSVVPGSHEIVLGSRLMDNAAPLRSRIGNRATRAAFRAVTGTCLYDTQTGLRGYPPELLPWLLEVEGDRFEYELNVLLCAGKAGVSIREERIATIYEHGNRGTHFRTFRDSYRVYRCLWQYLCTK